MKIFTISDTHTLHKKWSNQFRIPDADVIIHAGDLTSMGYVGEFGDFLKWFNATASHIEHKIFIAGNHDFGLENNKETILSMIPDSITYLEDSGIEIDGIKFWGSPVTPPFMTWAFMREPNKIKQHWDMIPDDTDVLITHGPPFGYGDFAPYQQEHVGCQYLLETIKRVKPKFHIYGHLHDGYGIYETEYTTHVNTSVLNDKYLPVRAGHLLEI